jgi:O-antigen chain-terminating methyltransferase
MSVRAEPGVSPGLAQPEPMHAADLLALPLDVFITTSYRRVLGREPDPAGAAHYQRMLLRGRFTRAEVLGRLAYSAEGRRRSRPLPGILPAFVLATLYRVPVAGPLAAILARLLRLPAHWQDRSTLEATALATGAWMKR